MKFIQLNIAIIFTLCLFLFTGCRKEAVPSAAESVPDEQAVSEPAERTLAEEITITTLEQAQMYFPKLLVPEFADGELDYVKYTPLTGTFNFYQDPKHSSPQTFLVLNNLRTAREGETVKQLDIEYHLTDGFMVQVSVQKIFCESNLTDDFDVININHKLYVRLCDDYADLIGKGGYSYHLTATNSNNKQALYEHVLRYEKPEPNFYDEHPDWFPVGRHGVSARNFYYFAGDLSNVETNGGYTLQIPEAIQDKIYIFSDVHGGVRIYLKARYGMEPIIHEKFGYAWPAPQHFAPFFSLYVTETEYPRLNSSFEHHLATDGQHYYTYSTAYDYSEHDAEMTPEQFFAPIDALGITADTFFDMMVFDNPDHVVRTEE